MNGSATRPASRDAFELAVICALAHEADAVLALFDRDWDEEGTHYGRADSDTNVYSHGLLGSHNVVLIHMPRIGKVPAAMVASSCRASYPNLQVALIVGICGSVPFGPRGEEIILGDIIISNSILESDFGRQFTDRFEPKGKPMETLWRASAEIRALYAKLESLRSRRSLSAKLTGHITTLQNEPELGAKYPGIAYDILFEGKFLHTNNDESCEKTGCDGSLVLRNRLQQAGEFPRPAIYCGRMASSDTVMRSAQTRDLLAEKYGVIAFEMESAGVWDSIPCFVIKGVCDYADSHKNKRWQHYAAATAAACAKAIVQSWPPLSGPSSQSAAPGLKVTTLPFGRNSSFVCRDAVLKRMKDGFSFHGSKPQSGTISCVIHGMGGVGKTQTALEFAYNFARPQDSIFWLQGETLTGLAETFSRIAKVLNLASDSEIQDQTQLITLAQQWLSRNTDWLLIFDNVVSFQSIRPYWPTFMHGSVIVTTQNQNLKHSSTFSIHLTPLSDNEGGKLLLQYLKSEDGERTSFFNEVDNASIISKELEGLPIAIAHVAGYIGQTGRSLSYFLEKFRERRSASLIWAMDSRDSTTLHYERTLDAVWDLALSTLGPEARSTLDILAMLNPDCVPEEMFLAENRRGSIEIELLCRHLVRPHAESYESALSIHRSLQKNLLFRLDRDPKARQSVFQRAMAFVRNCFPVQSPIGVPVNNRWAEYEKYLPHALALHKIYLESDGGISGTAELADLLCDAGYYMWDRNLGLAGISILESAEKICLQAENKHLRRLRANVGVAIGSLLNTIGISSLDRAVKIFDHILELRQQHMVELQLPHSREDQLLLSNAWNDKGWMCMESEDYAAAEACFERSLEIKRQWPEKDIPFEYAETIKNLALVRLSQKRSKDALELVAHARNLVEGDKEAGPASATGQKFRLYMAEVLANSGQIQEAIELSERVATGRRNLYRNYHPFNLDVYYFQGILFYYMGRFLEAEMMLRRSLSRDALDLYPPECTARCEYALSEVLRVLGNSTEAEKHRTEALNLLEEWRPVFMIPVSRETHESVLFDHVVPLKCCRLSRQGRLYVGDMR
ncbi:unnamed protein product [Penicillium glandicola]